MPPDKGTEPIGCSSDGPKNDIERFRQRIIAVLNKYPTQDTVFTLERWLNTYNFDIEEAAEHMTRALNGLDAIGALQDYDSAESLNEVLRKLSPAAEYFPGGIMGPDKHGNIVCVQPMGRSRPRTVMRLGRVSDLYRASFYEAEACMSLLRKEEAKRGCKLSVILISDLARLSHETIYMPAVKAYMNVLSILQYFFPESIKKIYVVNSPSAVNILYSMAKRVLSKKIIENIEFLGNNWKQRLKDEIGEEYIFKHWGGTKEASKETGTIRMAGEVPEDIRIEITKTLMFIPDEQLTKVSVSAGEALKIPVIISRPNMLLEWYFTVSSGEVDFKILCNEEEVWPQFRLSTEFVPEYGELHCQKIGTYVLHFESTAKLFNKVVAYNITMKDL